MTPAQVRVIWRDRLWHVAGMQGGSITLAPLPGAVRDQIVAYDDPLLDMDPSAEQVREYCPVCGQRRDAGSVMCAGCAIEGGYQG